MNQRAWIAACSTLLLVGCSLDLQVSDLETPDAACAGQAIGSQTRLLVQNSGKATTKPFSVGWYLSKDKSLDDEDTRLLHGRDRIGAVPGPGVTSVDVGDNTIPTDVEPGTWQLLVVLDEFDDVAESNERNNVRAREIEVLNPESTSCAWPVGEHVAGFDGLRYGAEGCVYWDEDSVEETTTTHLDGGTLERPAEVGGLIDVPPGEQFELAPSAMCNEFEEVTEVVEEAPQQVAFPPQPHPTCDESTIDFWCPDTSYEVPPPAFRPGSPEPQDPFGHEPKDEPDVDGPCSADMGWSFERGEFSPWTVNWQGNRSLAPVFGNDVSVERLRPPGFVPEPGTPAIDIAIGGDYWEFSRDVNQQGNWWVGTLDDRPTHEQRPRDSGGDYYEHFETDTGTITSPRFIVGSNYITFWLGGAAHASQRVELHILVDGDAEELERSRDGIGDAEFPDGWEDVPTRTYDEYEWVVVRASSPLEDNDYMGRQVVWDVDRYRDRTARLRIIDDAREPAFIGDQPLMAHINVDEFRCEDQPPTGTTFLTAFQEEGTPKTAVGHVEKPQPLWGTTESHSHATANLSFGGHMIWGDVDDELHDVYNCLHELPEITDDEDGYGGRDPISRPRRITHCNMRLEMVALVVSTSLGVCAAASATLAAVPIVGPLLAGVEMAACAGIVTGASVALTTTPVISGHYYHGARMPTSGAIKPGPFIQLVAEIFTGSGVRVHGMIEERDFDLPDGTHSGQGLGQFHNHYQKDMIRRAFEGGLRLMVIDVHNSRAMQLVLDGVDDYDDWQAIHDHIAAVERLVAGPDAIAGRGPLHDIAEIAYTPQGARRIIANGKLALVLGVEVMELGKLRSDDDTLEDQVADLHELGVRKITPIHGTNNPLGGTALFQDIYQSANLFNNLTADEGGRRDGNWNSVIPPIPFAIPGSFPFPFGGMTLGSWGVGDTLQARDCASDCNWNEENQGLFQVTDSPSAAVGPSLDFIRGEEDVNFLLGMPSLAPMQEVAGGAIPPAYLGVNRAHSLAWLLGRGPGGAVPARRCSLEHMALPLETEAPEPIALEYATHRAHFNALGLREEGSTFLLEMMKRGMVLDTDHFGQLTRLQTHELTRSFASAANVGRNDYAIFGVHTELRGHERVGPVPRHLSEHGGFESENSKTEDELRYIAESGGVITVSAPGYMTDANYAAGQVQNDCDYSSKSYSHKYLTAVELMSGRGVAPGFDMNGFAPFITSRYGHATACRNGVTVEQLKLGGYTPDYLASNPGASMLANWPRDWQRDAEVGSDTCRYNGSMLPEFWNVDCPSSINVTAQRREYSGVIYDDYDHTLGSGPERIVARRAFQFRDDGAPRPFVDEDVYVGGGGEFRQVRDLIKWQNPGAGVSEAFNTGWDVNLDGMRHVGMLPDLIQDMRNTGVTWELLTPMFNAAEDYVRMWERNCEMARAWRHSEGESTADPCSED